MKEKRVTKKTIKKIKELEKVDKLNYDNLENTLDFKKFNQAYDAFIEDKKTKKINLLINIFIIIIIIFSILISVWWNYNAIYFNNTNVIKEIKVLDYDEKSEAITLEIKLQASKPYQNIACSIGKNEKDLAWVTNTNYTCKVTTNSKNAQNIYLKIKNRKLKPYRITTLAINAEFLGNDKFYLPLKGQAKITYDYNYIGLEPEVTFKITNPEIATLTNNEIIAKKEGSTFIELYLNNQKYAQKEVIVTSLITSPPKHFNENKSYLSCNRYNQEEANFMDEILYGRIDDAGYQTRAGVVAAARFLTLEFPYRIDYFFENGRINSSGVHYADGEGRYYHRGLYLNQEKFKDIKYTFAGPAIWGCPLTNYEDYGKYVYGKKKPNGLDCSGFVTWALLNGGFDVGDYGAGETPEPNQMTDLGKRVKLSKEIVSSNIIKVGDLLNWWGHIALIVGIDNDTYYVAESLDTYQGLVIKEYKKSTLHDEWTFVMLMDDVYKQDGNITNMWY